MVRFVEARPEHAVALAPKLREGDLAEVSAMGLTGVQALESSLAASCFAFTALVDDQPEAMWGLCPVTFMGDRGLLWMLGSDQVPRHAYTVLLTSKHFVENVNRLFPVVECFVDLRYKVSVRWVRWLGFLQEQTVLFGGVEFGFFVRRA